VFAAVVLILISVLSAIGICERCHVQSGGVYFLISHVLGSRRGAAVGIIYVVGQVRERSLIND
jgi:potassium/chloride transporter 8